MSIYKVTLTVEEIYYTQADNAAVALYEAYSTIPSYSKEIKQKVEKVENDQDTTTTAS